MGEKPDRSWLLISSLALGVAICVLVGVGAAFKLMTIKDEPTPAPAAASSDDADIADFAKVLDKEVTLDKLIPNTDPGSSSGYADSGSRGEGENRSSANDRVYFFPGDGKVGILEVGRTYKSGYWDATWDFVGPAQGRVRIPANYLLRLKLNSTANNFSILSSFPPDAVNVLEYRGPSATPDLVKAIARFKRLKYMLIFNSTFADCNLSEWHSLKDLELISLEKSSIEEKDLADLAALTALKEIYLGSTRVNGKILCRFPNLAKLKVIDLQHTTCSDQTLDCLRKANDLNFLNLTATLITSNGLRSLSKLKALRILSLQQTQIDNSGLSHIKDLKTLDSLDLSDTKVGGGLVPLCSLASLRRLHLNRTRTNDSDITAISNLRGLIDLQLEYTEITDAAVLELSKLTHLRELHLPAAISNARANQLQKTLPACRIEKALAGR